MQKKKKEHFDDGVMMELMRSFDCLAEAHFWVAPAGSGLRSKVLSKQVRHVRQARQARQAPVATPHFYLCQIKLLGIRMHF